MPVVVRSFCLPADFLAHLLFQSLCLHFTDLPEPGEEDLIETFHLGMSTPTSLTLYIMSGCPSLYLFLSTAGGGSFFKDAQSEYNRMSLGVFSLLCSYSKRIVFSFL